MVYDNEQESLLSKNATKRRWIIGVVAFLGVLLVVLVIVTAVVITRDTNTTEEPSTTLYTSQYLDAIKINAIMDHLNSLQAIANNFNGSRAVQFGYDASADFIFQMIQENTDYMVEVQYFPLTVYSPAAPFIVQLVSPESRTLAYAVDYYPLEGFAGFVNVSVANITNVLDLGCTESDYVNVYPGSVALIERGNCTFREKVDLAANAGAIAVFIYNDGATPEREGLFGAALPNSTIPSFSLPYLLGSTLAEIDKPAMRLFAHVVAMPYRTRNIIAETQEGDPNNVIVVGSHLDSVPQGAGINDNGSGTAANLELAIQLYKTNIPVKNKVRFAWWGAEELGLLGSSYYVDTLPKQDLNKIALNLNYDMLGSPNFMYGVYNGSGASDEIVTACIQIQNLYTEWFQENQLPYELTPFTGRSDYGPFIEHLIPAGGLFSGAEELKTVAQRALYGGLANTPYDPCYHQSCDTIDNINQEAMENMAHAAAYTLVKLALQENVREWLNQAHP